MKRELEIIYYLNFEKLFLAKNTVLRQEDHVISYYDCNINWLLSWNAIGHVLLIPTTVNESSTHGMNRIK